MHFPKERERERQKENAVWSKDLQEIPRKLRWDKRNRGYYSRETKSNHQKVRVSMTPLYQIRVSNRIFVKLNQIQFTSTLASLTINLFMIWALGILFIPNERNRTVYRRACFFIWNFLGYTAGFYPLYNDIYLHISSQSVGCKALLLPVSTVQNPRLDYACSLVLHGHDKQDDAMGFYLYDRKETVENKSDQVIFLMSFTRNLSFLPRRSAVSSAVTW